MVVTTVAIRPEPMPARCANTTKFIAKLTMNPPTIRRMRDFLRP
jgi:hypothetical protein